MAVEIRCRKANLDDFLTKEEWGSEGAATLTKHNNNNI